MWLIAIDPGKHRAGVALFEKDRLAAVAEVVSDIGPEGLAVNVYTWAQMELTLRGGSIARGVKWRSEVPQDYAGHPDAKTDDLDSLRLFVRRVRELAGRSPFRLYKPHQWKGNVPKPVHHMRIMDLLSPDEANRVRALPRTRDALDAVGIGLFDLGRSGRGGVPRERR